MCKFLSCILLLFLPAITFAAPRERLLMDANWRFQLGDPADLPAIEFAYPEIKDLAKANLDDFEQEEKLAALRKDPVTTHLGEAVTWVQPGFDDAAWRQLNLPHDWAVELPFDKNADESHGYHGNTATQNNIGWYRKSFDLPADDKGQSLSIDFDGVFRNCVVWLNGHCLGRNVSGYIGFNYDISSAANYGGKNELVVRVDASRVEGWFYEGAGIYRHVWLNKGAPVHVRDREVSVDPRFDAIGGSAIRVRAVVRNDSAQDVTLIARSRATAPDGKIYGTASLPAQPQMMENVTKLTIAAGAEQQVEHWIYVDKPILWDLESPQLYLLQFEIAMAANVDEPVDSCPVNFGLRKINFDPNTGFFLNGKHVLIKGTCNHQDFAGVGTALPDSLHYFRLKKLKEFGCNAIRTSHNAPTPELLDACDTLGMLVMDEQRESGDTPEILDQLRRMIRRDRNHPSIILWSIGNEENWIQGNDNVGVTVAKKMTAAIRDLDNSRLITAAMNNGWGKGFSRVVDVQGFNYPLNTDVSKYHQKHPNQPLIASEEGSTVSTRGIYENDDSRLYVSAYDSNAPRWACTAERWWNYYQTRPFMAGAFVWTGFDYRGEPTRVKEMPSSWPSINSHFGILDTCGFPKDNFYYYQSIWTDKPRVHLLPHWNWPGREGKPIDVWAYSNCDEVELIVNGQSQGRHAFPQGKHLEWKIAYVPGSLVAHGYKGGQEVVTDKVETTGPPARLVLTPDRRTINADGEDVVVMTAAVVDDQDRIVPIASNLVKFAVEGVDAKVIGVGNGDPSCHEPDKAEQRSAFNGVCMVIIQSGKSAGEIKVTATANGLASATTVVQAQAATPRPKI